ncbi:PREDICTED: protein AAR2 homolog [Priapulus caudatus]|uniref:Protein AAR2 homolog n=1 Tax=Priapulus caudatus TaxID=37621 RepID=A0ABM1E899_PRICU|nr:PREDICTED: protein AAR2 homolog [Priapulus caudatus]
MERGSSKLDANQPMSQDRARKLLEDGAVFMLLDVPPGTEFGIDCNCWNTGDKFKGVKMIPPGLHFVYYSAVSKQGETAPRTGFFHNFQGQEFLVKKWDKYSEDISSDAASAEEVRTFRENLRDLDGFLGAYPYDSYKKWVSLSSHITPAAVARLQPLSGAVVSATQLEPAAATTTAEQRRRVVLDADNLPLMVPRAGTEIRFTTIARRSFPAGGTPADITKCSMDRSYVLASLFAADDDVLAELQFAFVCFLVGNVYDAFEQWKSLVALLCGSADATAARPRLFSDFVSVLYHQVREIPEDFFVDVVTRGNFLTTTLREFFATLETDDGVDAALRDKGLRFRAHLTKKFRWDFVSEPAEDAPVIVE